MLSLKRDIKKRFGASARWQPNSLLIEAESVTLTVPHGRLLDRATHSTNPRGRERLLAEIARSLQWAAQANSNAAAFDELVPVLLPTTRVEPVGDLARYTLPLSSDLCIAFASAGTTRELWLSKRQASALREPAALLPLALENLRALSDGVQVMRYATQDGSVLVLRNGDGLDSSRLLLHDLWEAVAVEAADDLVFSAPTRDRLYAAPASCPSSLNTLATLSTNDWERLPHSLSPTLWVRRPGGLTPWTHHA